MGPYAHKGNQWVGYDDVDMVTRKAQYILDNGLGGGMFWDLPSDDFKNLCGGGTYPLIRSVHNLLSSGSTCGNGGSATISSTTNGGSVTTSTEATTTSTSGGSNGGGDLCADPN